jgi:hypothetical protein
VCCCSHSEGPKANVMSGVGTLPPTATVITQPTVGIRPNSGSNTLRSTAGRGGGRKGPGSEHRSGHSAATAATTKTRASAAGPGVLVKDKLSQVGGLSARPCNWSNSLSTILVLQVVVT